VPDIIASGSLHEFLCKAHKEYGPIVSLWLGPKLAVSLGSAKMFAQNAHVFSHDLGKLYPRERFLRATLYYSAYAIV